MNTVCPEGAFRQCLLLERARSRRSGRQFLLVFIDMQAAVRDGGMVRPAVARAVFTVVSSCLRETDLVGWYRAGRVLGAVLTELGDGLPCEVAVLISCRLRAALSTGLASTARARVTLYCGSDNDSDDRNPCDPGKFEPGRARC
jgi:hypothetical protein